jgi:hypothetical protein
VIPVDSSPVRLPSSPVIPITARTAILRLNHLQTTYIPTPFAYRRIADHLLLVASLLLTQTQNKTMKFLQALMGLTLLFPIATVGSGPPVAPADFNCRTQLDPCWEVAISNEDKCEGTTVTYCLQPRIGRAPPPHLQKRIQSRERIREWAREWE